MVTRAAILTLTICAYLWSSALVNAGAVDVLSWELDTDIQMSQVGGDGDVTFTPTNPFQETQSATVGNSTAESIYDVSWDAAGFFNLLVEAEHAAQGNLSGRVRTGVSVDLIPAVDSVLMIEGEYTYDLANGDRESELAFSIWEAGVARILSVSHRAIAIAGDPRQGTFVDQATVPLDAGIHYDIGGFMILRSFGGSPTSLSLGDGHLRFSIVPVPEPHSAFLLILAAAACHSRRRRGFHR